MSDIAKNDILLENQNPLKPMQDGRKTDLHYYPGGMLMPGRSVFPDEYNFGFNGKLKDNELKGDANSYDYGERMYDPRTGSSLSRDPITRAFESSYSFVSDNPILYFDIDGAFKVRGTKRQRALIQKTIDKAHNILETNPKAMEAFMDWSGLSVEEIETLFQDENGPVLKMGGRFGANTELGNITIGRRHFEDDPFAVAMILLHESVHFGRIFKGTVGEQEYDNVLSSDELVKKLGPSGEKLAVKETRERGYQKDYSGFYIEAGIGFQVGAFGSVPHEDPITGFAKPFDIIAIQINTAHQSFKSFVNTKPFLKYYKLPATKKKEKNLPKKNANVRFL